MRAIPAAASSRTRLIVSSLYPASLVINTHIGLFPPS